ncbi:hypothetical protein KJ918_02905, partial [Patescibacteria group bacterium]|nr:hypothetical protein [Patescibacteria group bacterium]
MKKFTICILKLLSIVLTSSSTRHHTSQIFAPLKFASYGNPTHDSFCIAIELDTDNPSTSPTLESMNVNYETITSSISGIVWIDQNKNGKKDEGEV